MPVYIRPADINGNADAFGRLRVSNPQTIFDSKQIVDKLPTIWDDQLVSGSGGASTYNINRASTILSVDNATVARRVRQTFRRFNYQPGKSQLFIMTFVMGTAASGITRCVGQYDDNNGLFLKQDNDGLSFVTRSYVTGSVEDNEVYQADWNIDTLDGTGPSRISLNMSKAHILFVDYEWLGVGRVRWGFFIDGNPIYAHESLNAGNETSVYMSTPNLPLRYEIKNDGSGAAAGFESLCSTIISEGGISVTGNGRAANRGATSMTTLNDSNIYPLISMRLQSGKISASVIPTGFEIVCTSTAAFAYYVVVNPTIVGTALSYSAITNSAVEADIVSTNATTITGGTVIYSGVTQSDRSGSVSIDPPASGFTLGSAINGTRDVLVLAVQRLTGTTEQFFGSMGWREE